MNNTYSTLSEAIAALREQGYSTDFNLSENTLDCQEPRVQLSPDQFIIDAVYRFDDDTDPDDQSVLYAISSQAHGLKGLLVNGYGIYSDGTSDALIAKLAVRH